MCLYTKMKKQHTTLCGWTLSFPPVTSLRPFQGFVLFASDSQRRHLPPLPPRLAIWSCRRDKKLQVAILMEEGGFSQPTLSYPGLVALRFWRFHCTASNLSFTHPHWRSTKATFGQLASQRGLKQLHCWDGVPWCRLRVRLLHWSST